MASDERQVGDKQDLARREREMREILLALEGLKFGVLTVVIQDGVVVQIDRTEKRRLVRKS